MNTTRFAAPRAKPISWVTTTMVIPSLANDVITLRTSLIISGSSGRVGSSNSMTFGFIASDRAIATRFCWPPDSCAGYLSAWLAMPTRTSSDIAFSRASAFDFLRTFIGASVTLSRIVLCANRLNDWNTMPTSDRSCASFLPSWGSTSPSIAIVPESMGSSRLIARHNVDLPEPDGPSTTMTCPRSTFRLMSLSTCRLPKCLLTPSIDTIGTPVGVGSTSFTSDPVGSMGADLTQGTPSLPGTRQSAQIAPLTCPYHGAVTSMATREAAADSRVADSSRERSSDVRQALAVASSRERSSERTYQVRTYGCQMNVHDSERLAGLLEAAGYRKAAHGADADVVVFNTCAVRENADNKLYGNLSHLAPRKQADPDMQIAVGGCLAQKDRDAVLRRAPWVDVVFGTHNIGSLPTLLERARHNREAQVEIVEALQEFPSALPAARESAYAAWVSISVGCNNTCTFCIVPALRGKEVDRRPGDVLAEVQSLVDQGVLEVTLLGQNVNAYGMSFADLTETPRDRGAFAALLRACGRIDGLERVRFTSPHPAEFTDDVIDAMAQTPNVCPALHMPLQSGSDRMLKAMRRSYRAQRYLGIIDRVRAAMPHAAITTDIIVGFPGETEDDFQATLDVVRQARFSSAFTFQYSKRPGTPAAELPDQLPKDVVQERYERLIAVQEEISLQENVAQIGRSVELLVAAGEGRKDTATARMSGRARDGRLVHFTPGDAAIRPGDVVTTVVTDAAPHHLIADGTVSSHRRTRAGDAHEAGRRPRTVGLGLPGLGAPAPSPQTAGCAQ